MSASQEPQKEPPDDKPARLGHWYGYQIAGLICVLAIPVVIWLFSVAVRGPRMNTILIFLVIVMVVLASEAWYDLARWRRNAGRPTTHSQQLTKIGMTLGWLLVVLVALVLLLDFLGRGR